MALETRLYLAPRVELREVQDGETVVTRSWKPWLYLPAYDGVHEETFYTLETRPADDPEWRIVELTADASIHEAIDADPDIVRL